MKYRESIKLDEEEYDRLYGHLPNTQIELVKYLIDEYKVKEKDLREAIEKEKQIPWREVTFKLNILPWATPRARLCRKTGTFYVKGASKHRKMINKYIDSHHIIFTKTYFIVKTYQPTPKQMSRLEKVLFEMGVYQPLSDPDWDNLGKTYSDMVQSSLLLNDNLIVRGHVEKYYSIKPRVEIIIQYQESFDCNFNKRRVTHTESYKRLIEGMKDNDAEI